MTEHSSTARSDAVVAEACPGISKGQLAVRSEQRAAVVMV
jgi:hypothetical protein